MSQESSSSPNVHEPKSIAALDPDLLLSHEFPDWTVKYSEREVSLYNWAVGACAQDESQDALHKHQTIQVLPTFASQLTLGSIPRGSKIPGLIFNRRTLKVQEYIQLYKPLPSSATLRNRLTVTGLHDRGTSAILDIKINSFNAATLELLFMTRTHIMLPGAGGFSDSSDPLSYFADQTTSCPQIQIPAHDPIRFYEDRAQVSQAIMFTQPSEWNPLYADPGLIGGPGYFRRILHPFCTMGFAVKAVIKVLCNGQVGLVRSTSGQFLSHVYPGETLITEMWLMNSRRIIYRTKVKERYQIVVIGHVDALIPQQ